MYQYNSSLILFWGGLTSPRCTWEGFYFFTAIIIIVIITTTIKLFYSVDKNGSDFRCKTVSVPSTFDDSNCLHGHESYQKNFFSRLWISFSLTELQTLHFKYRPYLENSCNTALTTHSIVFISFRFKINIVKWNSEISKMKG